MSRTLGTSWTTEFKEGRQATFVLLNDFSGRVGSTGYIEAQLLGLLVTSETQLLGLSVTLES